ncbi:copper resistance protein CopC [Actinobacteria bacterium OK074]|nr:copper resistance protein CopC [Actinobacteria bacterium OK074]
MTQATASQGASPGEAAVRTRTGAVPRKRAPRARAVRALLVLLFAAAGLLLGTAAPASAHAALTGSDPLQGTVAAKAPTQVSLTFSEKVTLADDSLKVLDPKGKRVDTGNPGNLTGTTYGVPLRSGLAKGTYTVSWHVVSADSHPVAGAFTFSIGAPSTTTVSDTGENAGGGVVGDLYGFGRYVSYAGFIVLVGGAAFVLVCWPRGAGVRVMQRFVVSGWLALTAATLALLVLRGSYTDSGKVSDIFDLSLVGPVLQTKAGAALVSRLLLLAASAMFIAVLFGAYARQDEPADADAGTRAQGDAEEDAADGGVDRRDLTFGLAIGGTVISAGLAATWAMAEHASTGIQTGVAMPVDVVHLLSVATWLGGLSALLLALYKVPAIESAAVRRFSRVAFGSVLLLAATGIYQAWRQLGSWSALTDTAYGQLLLVKVGLVAVLVGIASISRRWTARLADTDTLTDASAAESAADDTRVPVAAARVSGAVAKASSSGTTVGTTAKAPKGGKGGGKSGDPRRAEQLARQKAAAAAAKARRIRDADPLRAGLRRSVFAETGVAIVLLAVTTVLTTTEPGRTEEIAKAATSAAGTSKSTGEISLKIPFDTGGTDGKGTAEVTLDPAAVGLNEMHVYVSTPAGKAFDVPEVKVALTLGTKDIGPLPVTLDRIATAHWAATGLQIPQAGDWSVAVTVRTSDIDQVTVTKNAQIG